MKAEEARAIATEEQIKRQKVELNFVLERVERVSKQGKFNFYYGEFALSNEVKKSLIELGYTISQQENGNLKVSW